MLQYGGGFVGLIVLILDLIVMFEIFNSTRPIGNWTFAKASAIHGCPKLGWALLIFFFPIIGLVIYFLFSDRHEYNGSQYQALP
ncbi:hypothetical protein BZG36_01752 [Bifiguratus adelaidae]|uniref:Cardiolipin synthase N-terminal domain-containing protein n=1 Tax=Bifiguratus adelaidae TaxID=1938954 RepID=A0A261Y2Z0_9FUNG|nr:hypothetical protein BZG36_01752 [Bifiguratus adelaidae]